MLQACWYVFYTECLLGMRRSQEWLFPVCFFVIVVTLFPLAFTPDTKVLATYFPGFIWLAALFASLLAVSTIFSADIEEGHLEQMTLTEIPFSMLLIAKLTAHWVMTMLPLIILTPILGMMFQVSESLIFTLCIGLLAGTPALIFINTFGTALTLGLKQQGVVLGLLVLPLTVPILIFGVSIVLQSQAGFSYLGGLSLLAALSLIAILCLPLAIAGVIKASMDD